MTGEAVLVDVSEKCLKDRDYQVQVKDFLAWEERYGRIPDEAIILIKTGFGRFWPDRIQYMGTEERGAEALAKLHFPGMGVEAARWLIQNRKPKWVGLDTPSIDYGQSKLFETHVALFASNIPVLENLASLDKLPSKDFYVLALPMKIKEGSGGPTRVIAFIKNDHN